MFLPRASRSTFTRSPAAHSLARPATMRRFFNVTERKLYIWVYWLAKVFGLRLEIRLDDILYQKSFCGGYIIMYCLAVIEIRIGAFMGNVVSKVACE